MPHTFRATVHKIQSDGDQETTLTVKVPISDYDSVAPLGKLTKRVLVFTVFTEDELHTEGGDHADSAAADSDRD